MASTTIVRFPIFAPIFPFATTKTTSTASPTTEVRFSRWNNANAEKFLRQKRTQKEIEDDIRRYRRFESALSIANLTDSNATTTAPPDATNNQNTNFKSIGTPSTPSLPSIPGKKSKYSKNPNSISIRSRNSKSSHPAFQKSKRGSLVPETRSAEVRETTVKIGKDGLSYVVAGAPFEYMYSYTETPKVKPLALREPPVAPFESGTMTRPWTGRKPLPPSKKKLPEFDSFVSPPVKKGVKPVQKPGPFLPGSGPRYVMTRDEVLGEPLTPEEVKSLVEGCRKSKRQLNIGRDGLTHNMLDNIHALWKRRRVCKIKCKGVCTVDMNNVCQQLEEKSGGKVISRKGGVLYLFRGRNYNYKTRPRFPLMLWKPVTPVYPRLIQRVPEGLTYDEATAMRRRGHHLTPICKLAKNGVYVGLVKEVREAFEACELVRINCQGLNGSDYRKIAAKLKDLVPCVLISFQEEHILMWRGRNWKSSLSVPGDSLQRAGDPKTDAATLACSYNISSLSSGDFEVTESDSAGGPEQVGNGTLDVTTSVESLPVCLASTGENDASSRGLEERSSADVGEQNGMILFESSTDKIQNVSNFCSGVDDGTKTICNNICGDEVPADSSDSTLDEPTFALVGSEVMLADIRTKNQLETSSCNPACNGEPHNMTEASEARTREMMTGTAQKLSSSSVENVLLLLHEAVEGGSAVVLGDECLDADVVFERSVAFSKIAPPGPIFRRRPRKALVEKPEDEKDGDVEVKEVVPLLERQAKEKKISKFKNRRARNLIDDGIDVPQGTLGVDELAKLLA